MMLYKPFKVALISSNPNSFGLYGHIMVAEDGESWQVRLFGVKVEKVRGTEV